MFYGARRRICALETPRATLHVHCAVHEIFEAQRSAEEAFDAVIKHVQVGIIVQGADGSTGGRWSLCS